jgi:hypothetical protein
MAKTKKNSNTTNTDAIVDADRVEIRKVKQSAKQPKTVTSALSSTETSQVIENSSENVNETGQGNTNLDEDDNISDTDSNSGDDVESNHENEEIEFIDRQVALFRLNPKKREELTRVLTSYGPRIRMNEWSLLIESDLDFLATRDYLYGGTFNHTESETIDLALRDFRRMVSERVSGHKYDNSGGYPIAPVGRETSTPATSSVTQMITSTNKYPTLKEVTKVSINTFELEYSAYVGSTGQGIDKTRWSDSVQATVDMYWLMHPLLSKNDWRSEYVITTKDLLQFVREKMSGKGEQHGYGSPILNLQNNIAEDKILYNPHEPRKMNERIVEIKVLMRRANIIVGSDDNKNLMVLGLKSLFLDVKDPKKAKLALEASIRAANLTSFDGWLNHVYVHAGNRYTEYLNSLAFGPSERESSSIRLNKRSAHAISTEAFPAKSKGEKLPASTCKICGRSHGGQCNFKDCAWANHTSSPWASSIQGKKYKELKYDFLPKNREPSS